MTLFKILKKRTFIFGIINYPHYLGPQTIDGGQVVAVGGRHATALPSVDIFDPVLETWRVRTITPRSCCLNRRRLRQNLNHNWQYFLIKVLINAIAIIIFISFSS